MLLLLLLQKLNKIYDCLSLLIFRQEKKQLKHMEISKAIELGGDINENSQWVLLRTTNPFTLLAFNILNDDAEFMHTIVLVQLHNHQSSSSVQKNSESFSNLFK